MGHEMLYCCALALSSLWVLLIFSDSALALLGSGFVPAINALSSARSAEIKNIDVRVIVATNKDLEKNAGRALFIR
jgi:hypothetical protein